MNFDKVFVLTISVILFLLLCYTIIYKPETPELTKDINLYFTDQQAMHLIPESREINTTNNLYINTIKELIKGPKKENLNKTIPQETEVLDVEIVNKTGHINFNQALRINHWGGSTGEIITVYSIVNTLTQFDDINSVQILVEGNKIETLNGHLDLTGPLNRDEDLIEN